ncbi:MAG TPA: hypothetical protein VIY90_23755 [Steroidobacteraceae bacterium]
MSAQSAFDPRVHLIREKYFSLRPKPLERWLWSQGVPASAERVFWLHWQEGHQRGDWCSEIPLKRVARECCLDPSTVTRSYQLLGRLGCLRRTDPGRDPSNPFQQATAVTEVRVPRGLLIELDRHPNRRSPDRLTVEPGRAQAAPEVEVSAVPEVPRPADPFTGLRGRDRIKALAQLTAAMSATEESRYREALRVHRGHMEFDTDSALGGPERGRVLQFLACVAVEPVRPIPPAPATTPRTAPARKLSAFELARLKRDIQAATSVEGAAELLRQVTWSIEEGSLRRFSPLHALHIALKKIREGAWSRPHRMPPNWTRALSAARETCRPA